MALGPAGEILRLAGDRAAHLQDDVRAALTEGLSEFERPDGTVYAGASSWIVTALAPPE
jgi:kynureninase